MSFSGTQWHMASVPDLQVVHDLKNIGKHCPRYRGALRAR